MSTQLYLVFPDRETACYIAAALIGDTVENLHADGWWTNPETGQLVYWNLDDIGTLYKTEGEGEEAVSVPLEGYHINGWWHSDSPVPPALAVFQVFPKAPLRVWG